MDARGLTFFLSVTAVVGVLTTHCTAQKPTIPRYGVNLFLARRYSPEEYAPVFDRLREGNIRLVREEISLTEIYSRDTADFSRYESALKALRRNGIYPLLLLSDPRKEWTTEELAGRLVDTVGRLKRYSRHFQILNEVNTQRFWGGPPDPGAYTALMKTVYSEVKRRYPEVTLIAAGLASPDLLYLKTALQAGLAEYVDAFALHPYTFPLPLRGIPEDLVLDFIRMVIPKPVWITEIGWPVGIDREMVDVNQQAMFLEEALMRLSLVQEIPAILWYELRDARHPGEGVEGRFGLLEFDLTPKPAWASLVSKFTRTDIQPIIVEDTITDLPGVFLSAGMEAEIDLATVTGPDEAVAVPLDASQRAELAANCAHAIVRMDPPGHLLGFYLLDRTGEIFSGVIERVMWEGEREIYWVVNFYHKENLKPLRPLTFTGFIVQPVSQYLPVRTSKVKLTIRDLQFCRWGQSVRSLAPIK